MDVVLRRIAAAPMPRASRGGAGAALVRELMRLLRTAIERLPSARRELTAEWFRFPLP